MGTVTRFDRPTAKMVEAVAERAVREALAPYGLNVRGLGGTIGEGSFVMRIEAAVVQADGLVLDRDADAFRQVAAVYGFDPADLGRTFEDGGHAWKVVGLKPSAEKYPVVVEREDGRRFKMDAPRILRALGREVPSHLEPANRLPRFPRRSPEDL